MTRSYCKLTWENASSHGQICSMRLLLLSWSVYTTSALVTAWLTAFLGAALLAASLLGIATPGWQLVSVSLLKIYTHCSPVDLLNLSEPNLGIEQLVINHSNLVVYLMLFWYCHDPRIPLWATLTCRMMRQMKDFDEHVDFLLGGTGLIGLDALGYKSRLMWRVRWQINKTSVLYVPAKAIPVG